MTTLLDTVNNTREETLKNHYGAATVELEREIKNHPLRTIYYITAGCESEKITREIAHRFTQGKIKANPNYSYGLTGKYWYLTVEPSLPSELVREADKNITQEQQAENVENNIKQE